MKPKISQIGIERAIRSLDFANKHIYSALLNEYYNYPSGNEILDERKNNLFEKFIPSAILLAFNIELKFKYLISFQNRNLYGHDLKVLFEQLSSKFQEKIKFGVEKELELSEADFSSLIENNRNTFIQLRYFFEEEDKNEKIRIDYNFLRILDKTTGEIIKEFIEIK